MRRRVKGVPRAKLVGSTNPAKNKLLSDLLDKNSLLCKAVQLSEKKGIGRDKIIEVSKVEEGEATPMVIQTMPYKKRLLRTIREFSRY
jgi:hypothetical protein